MKRYQGEPIPSGTRVNCTQQKKNIKTTSHFFWWENKPTEADHGCSWGTMMWTAPGPEAGLGLAASCPHNPAQGLGLQSRLGMRPCLCKSLFLLCPLWCGTISLQPQNVHSVQLITKPSLTESEDNQNSIPLRPHQLLEQLAKQVHLK